MLLMTMRPEFQPPWKIGSHVLAMTVNHLLRKQVAEMVGRMMSGKQMPAEVLEQVVAKTDGVPLFVEELTKAVVESAWSELKIPDSLQGSLMARLDRLGEAKEVAQLAAAIGRDFSRELLTVIAERDAERLEWALSCLEEAQLVYERDPGQIYSFRHALIRDAAYSSLLKSTRRTYHGKIADALVERFPQIAHAQPELVAHHYTASGARAKAAGDWGRG